MFLRRNFFPNVFPTFIETVLNSRREDINTKDGIILSDKIDLSIVTFKRFR